MVILPVFAAIALGAGTIIERIILKKKNISIKFYETYSFLAIVLVMIPFIFFLWNVSPDALLLKNILILAAVVVLAILANYFTFYSMKWEKLSKLEPAKMVEPLFTILLAIIFSIFIDATLYERNIKIIIPAIIAGAALIFSHFEKHHLKFNKYFLAAIIGSFFFASELVVSRLILDNYSSFTFYFVRCTLIFILSLAIFRPSFTKAKAKTKTIFFLLLTGAIWVAFRTILYYGYTTFGIIFTTLIIMLGPVFIYLFAWIFLKDKPTWKNIVASIVILGAVLYGLFI